MRNACLFLVAVILLGGCATSHNSAATPTDAVTAPTTVVWISIDGFRHDYLQRFSPPTLTRLAKEGALTTQETPIFPSLTFPNHVAQVTGARVDGHGIPMNAFYDEADGQSYSFPDKSSLVRVEPIWQTATRQGVRVLCVDWPMSHAQTGPSSAAYFDDKFDSVESDSHRLDRIIGLLTADPDRAHPYRLVMGYMSGVDHIGHMAGPESKAIGEAVLEADREIEHFMEGVSAWFSATHSSTDRLVFVFSTDHGMTSVKSLVNLERLIGADLVGPGTQVVTSGPVATIHCPADRSQKIVDRLKADSFLTAWKSQDVSAAAHFSDSTRVGQVVVMLKPGYSFTKQRLATTLPVPKDAGGMHGYDPAGFTDMQGSAIIWRKDSLIGGQDMGPMENTQWDATVCKLLGIRPPATADQRAVTIR